jgi:CobQ-like glutamine amidotransferase family enzyme
MNLYGDYGNVSILKSRLIDQGAEVNVVCKTIGDEISFDDTDFVYCGAGTESNLLLALEDLKRYKEDFIRYIDSGKPCLFTGNSMEMLGKSISSETSTIEAFSVFGYEAKKEKERIIGNVIIKSDAFNEKIVGFVNKQATIKDDSSISGINIYNSSHMENSFYVKESLISTYITGPILVKNPELLDFFVKSIISKKDSNYEIKKIEYPNEDLGYKQALINLENNIG